MCCLCIALMPQPNASPLTITTSTTAGAADIHTSAASTAATVAASSSYSSTSRDCCDPAGPAPISVSEQRLLRKQLLQSLYSQAMQDALSAASASLATAAHFGADGGSSHHLPALSMSTSSATSTSSMSSSLSSSMLSSVSSLSHSTSSLPLASPLTSPLPSPSLSPVQSAVSATLPVEPFYDVDLFVSAVPDHLICAICTGVVHSPLNLACSHLFCAQCLAQWCQSYTAQQAELAAVAVTIAASTVPSTAAATASGAVGTTTTSVLAQSQSASSQAVTSSLSPAPATSPSSPPPVASHHCPTCRAPFSLFLASPNHAIQHQIANLTVRCPNHAAGCSVQLQMGSKERNVTEHRLVCSYEKVRCRLAGCGAVMERRGVERHQRIECKQRLRECGDCGEYVKCGEWDAHRSGVLGCVGLMYCPHKCTVLDGEAEVEHEQREEDSRKKRRVVDEKESDASQATDGVAMSDDVEPQPATLKLVTTTSASSTSSSTSTIPSFSSVSSPMLEEGSSGKRKFDSFSQPSGSVDTTDSQPSSTASSQPSPSLSRSEASSPQPSSRLKVIRRSALADHLSVCPVRPIQCDLCFAPVLRCQLSQHYADNVASHLLALHRTVRTDRVRSDLLTGELVKLRKENSLLRKEMAELSRHVHSGPLFAYFFDIAPISLLCSHYISNDFVCGDHVFYFALHRQQHLFSAYLYLKSGTTPIPLSFVLMVKQRKGAESSPGSEAHQVAGAVDAEMDDVEASGLVDAAAAVDAAAEPQDDLPSALSPVTSFSASSSTAFSASSSTSTSPVCLRVKLDVEYRAAEGKGVSNWFTLADLHERGGYNSEEDALTIGVLIKDHSSSWVYSAADALNPITIASMSDDATVAHAAIATAPLRM